MVQLTSYLFTRTVNTIYLLGCLANGLPCDITCIFFCASLFSIFLKIYHFSFKTVIIGKRFVADQYFINADICWLYAYGKLFGVSCVGGRIAHFYRQRSEGDNVLGSVHLSIIVQALSRMAAHGKVKSYRILGYHSLNRRILILNIPNSSQYNFDTASELKKSKQYERIVYQTDN